MKINLPTLAVCGASLFVALAGCSRKSDVNTELDRAASVMEQPVPPQPLPPAPVQTEQPVQPEPAPEPAPPPATEMREAVAAYKAGNLQDAVARLQKLRATRAMTPQQRIALNDAMASVMGEIYSMAASGDQRAVQAVKQYEEMQTKSR